MRGKARNRVCLRKAQKEGLRSVHVPVCVSLRPSGSLYVFLFVSLCLWVYLGVFLGAYVFV